MNGKQDLELIIPQHLRKEYGLDTNSVHDWNQPSTSTGVTRDQEELRPCNFRLASGKLCPRRDKVKCPFHGVIIARDSEGVPINESERREEEERTRKRERERPEWQDPALLRELEAATGIDLTLPSLRKKRKTNQKYPGLKNVSTCDVTPRQRLEKKVLSKATRERVAGDLNAIDRRRSDRFGDQWNYAISEDN
jgi:hypothetical protein